MQAFDAIAGYAPGTDVVQHNQIDLDQQAIQVEAKAYNFATATSIYTSGGVNIPNGGYNSMSNGGAARTLQGFSTKAKAKMYDIPSGPYKTYKKFYDYYGDFDYANRWVMAALYGTTYTPTNAATTHALGFSSTEDAARKEAVKKGTAYGRVDVRDPRV